MKSWKLAALFCLSASAFAQTSDSTTAPTARKSCDDLKAEISKKLNAKGVTSYTLDAVDKGKEADAKVVGTCDGGTKSMVYSRGAATASKANEDKKPQ